MAAHADDIWVAQLGAAYFGGPGGTSLYFKEALDRLAVDVHVFRAGDYKSAVEPYTRSAASDEAREANQALVDALWEIWLSDVSGQRSGADVRTYMQKLPAMLEDNPSFAEAALAAGIVDKIGSRPAFDEDMTAKYGSRVGTYNHVPLGRYLGALGTDGGFLGGDAVGIVYVSGEIIDGYAPSGTAGGTTISDLVYSALENDDIKSLVVRVNSPGGSVTASEQIRDAFAVAKSRGIPVVASFGPVAASGGYWIATAADEIFAEPATITGSIGAFAILPSFDRALAKLGVHTDNTRSTPYSGAPNVVGGLTPEVEAFLQSGIEDVYRRFTGLVGDARGLPPETVERIAQGRVWDGGTAHQLGLVDHLGGLSEAIASAASRADLNPNKVRTIDIEVEPSLPLQMLDSLFAEEESGKSEPVDAATLLSRTQQQKTLGAVSAAARIAGGPATQVRCLDCLGLSEKPVIKRQSALPSWLSWLAAAR